MTDKRLILLVVAAVAAMAACSRQAEDPAAEVDRIASEFVHGYYAQHPEEAYEFGYPDVPLDRFGDHSAAAEAGWDARIDGWLQELDAIEPAAIAGTPAATTHAFASERLRAIVDRRICRTLLWNVSPTWTGWQYMIVSSLAAQPVGTAAEQDAALARARDIERYLATEIDNLRSGQELGYLAPASNVAAVIEQVTSLIDTPVGESPFMDPAERSNDAEFQDDWRTVYTESILPAMVSYRDFLAQEYEGRDAIGVAANPDGEACYAASVRYWSSLPMDAGDIHRRGLSEMGRIRSEMLAIAQDSFGTSDLAALFDDFRSLPEYTFESEQAVLDYVGAAVERARGVVPDWFGHIPDAEFVIKPSPAYKKDSGGGFYSAGSADGTRPGTYLVGTYNPRGISRAGQEAIAFHESIPGHHLQGSIALFNEALHPIQRFMYVSGTGEGWALYTEKLADEMGLYSSEMSRLGMLSNEAWRAARLVVDPGMHVLGWTREQAIDYMLEHTAEGYDSIASEIDRYAAVPGQATAYLVGSLEIQRLRAHAETLLGDDFDIREFHDRVLANGSVTLPMLGEQVDAWIGERTTAD